MPKVPRPAVTSVTKIVRDDRTAILANGETITLTSLFDHRDKATQDINAAKRAIGHYDGQWYEVSFLKMEATVTNAPPDVRQISPNSSKTRH